MFTPSLYISITILVLLSLIRIDVLSLLSSLFVDKQTSHLQVITGTPWDVPVPKKVISIMYNYIVKLYIIIYNVLARDSLIGIAMEDELNLETKCSSDYNVFIVHNHR